VYHGAAILRSTSSSPQEFQSAIQTVLSEASYREASARLQREIAKAPKLDAVAELIETVFQAGRKLNRHEAETARIFGGNLL